MDRSKIILASASPRRFDLLKQINIIPDFVIAPDIDETRKPKEKVKDYVIRMAIEKAKKIANEYRDAIIISADTVVYRNHKIIDKAECDDDVRRALLDLSGKKHKIYSCVCVIKPDNLPIYRLVESAVKFKRISQSELDRYIITGEGIGKAGGYSIQGCAGYFVKWMQGSFSAIVGLPLYETKSLLNIW